MPKFDLPYDVTRGPAWERRACYLFWAALLTVLVVTCVQFQLHLRQAVKAGERADAAYLAALAAYEKNPTAENNDTVKAAAMEVREAPREGDADIIEWRRAVGQFWQVRPQRDIYRDMPDWGEADPLTGLFAPGYEKTTRPAPLAGNPPELIANNPVYLHPNMPFVVILLTPLSNLSVLHEALAVNLLKCVCIVLTILAAGAVVNNERHKQAPWILGLAVLMALPLLLADIRQGNTSTFAMAAVAGHLWLYRRRHDYLSGLLLALAICLKLSPALLLLYWMYQRNWRLVGGVIGCLAVMVVAIPAWELGLERYQVYMGDWMGHIIIPRTVNDLLYPAYVNQSLEGVFSRLFMGGNIYYNPEEMLSAERTGFVTLWLLPLGAAKWVLVALEAAFVAIAAWAISWRKLPRDDARRGLHYALLLAGMVILNHRTWDYHAGVLVIAYAAILYALAYGRIGRAWRIAGAVLMFAIFVTGWCWGDILLRLIGGNQDAQAVIEAYGTLLAHFVLVFAAAACLLRRLRGEEPYSVGRYGLAHPAGGAGPA